MNVMNHLRSVFVGLAVGLVLDVGVLAAAPDYYPPEVRSEAKNPAVMYLFPEAGKLQGWVSGKVNADKVHLKHGETEVDLPLDKSNRFQWKLDTDKAQTVVLEYGTLKRVVTVPAPTKDSPVAFFVVDRSVCRPGSTLHFTAFIREMNPEGRYQPLGQQEVEVEIKSVSKGIVAAKIKLRSDDAGRVVGDYTFSQADSLDDYDIAFTGAILGKANVKLAEFRKAKVRLDISGERAGGSMKIVFKALDFLGKKVPASKLKYQVQVRQKRTAGRDIWGLDPKAFYAWKLGESSWYEMGFEQQALDLAGSVYPYEKMSGKVVHTFSGELDMGKDGEAAHQFLLDPVWEKDCVLEIQGVVVDSNDREQEAFKTIALSEQTTGDFLVELDQAEVPAGNKVTVSAKSASGEGVRFLVFELQNTAIEPVLLKPRVGNIFHQGPSILPLGGSFINGNIIQPWQIRPIRSSYYRNTPLRNYTIQRRYITMLDGVSAADDNYSASLILARPGAYVIQAVGSDAKGKRVFSETALVVHAEKRMNAVHLSLDNDALENGSQLRGVVQCQYEGAKVLLVVRDSQGVRAIYPFTVKSGDDKNNKKGAFSIPLPERLSLGCSVTALYSDDGHTVSQHRRRFLVRPAEQKIKILSTVPDTVEPGEEVELQFQVDKNEEVDLVVSVYDQSLLGIAPHKAVDGRSLFFADTRVEQGLGNDIVNQCLAGLTLAELKSTLDQLLADKVFKGTIQANYLTNLHNMIRGGYLNEVGARMLLAWRGAPINLQALVSNNRWHIRLKKEEDDFPVSELLTREGKNYHSKLRFHVQGGQLGIVVERVVNGRPQILFNEWDQRRGWYANGWNYFGLDGQGGGGGFGERRLRRGSFQARADSGWGGSANASLSFGVSGQSMASHMPGGGDLPPSQGVGGAAMMIRRDFSDSAYFNGRVRTDKTGVAKVKFKLPDSLTNWQVVVTAVSRDLSIGHHTTSFKTFKPVMVWPMLSQSFTAGDRVNVFAKVHNYTEKEQEFTVATKVKNGKVHGQQTKKVTIPAKSNKSVYFDFEAGHAGFAEILMSATCPSGQDASLKRLPVNPCTAEQVITRSGFVTGGVGFKIPDGVNLDQARLEVTIAPTIAGDMLDTLGYLIDYPHGCVEQTMSRFLPVIKVAQILKDHKIEDKDLEAKVPLYAEAGIKRLLQLQRKDGGWGWQGKGKTHEMMTPYALYGLIEAQKAGYTIPSEDAIDRGMARLEAFINQMGTKQSADRIYCMWVYRQHKPLKKEWWSWLEKTTRQTLSAKRVRNDLLSDYAAALALEMSAVTGRKQLSGQLARLLSFRMKGSDSQAYWTTSGFSRWGNDRFEITAAVLKAMAAHNPQHHSVPRILNFFASTKRGNRWNSTKDTAMILYAMCDYLKSQGSTDQRGDTSTSLAINDRVYQLSHPTWRPKTITIPGEDIKSNMVDLKFLKGNKAHLYRLVFRYWKEGGDVVALNQGADVRRTFELIDSVGKSIRPLKSGDTVPRGSYVRSTLSARLTSGSFQYALAVNPKIAGAEYTPLNDVQVSSVHALKEDKASGVFWHHEIVHGRLNNSSVCRVELAGKYLVAPAYVELMYDTAVRGHSGSFSLIVTDQQQQ